MAIATDLKKTGGKGIMRNTGQNAADLKRKPRPARYDQNVKFNPIFQIKPECGFV